MLSLPCYKNHSPGGNPHVHPNPVPHHFPLFRQNTDHVRHFYRVGPLPLIPINLALFAVYLAGALLGPWRGALSLLVYLLLAAVGVPVMAGFRGGMGNLVGNTGGYVVGYIFAAFFTGLLVEKWGARFWQMCVAMVLGCAVCYFFGTLWYSILSGTPFFASFSACVVPFLPCDVVKILLAALLASRLRPALKRQGLL